MTHLERFVRKHSSVESVSIVSASKMPVMMMGRSILHKQTTYGFYRPGAVAFANTLADIPFSTPRILVFNIIVYYMSHLDRSAGGFFTFHLFTYSAFLAMQGFFRTMGLLCRNFDSAFRVGTFFVPNMVTYAGYVIPSFKQQRWLFWIVRSSKLVNLARLLARL